MARKQIVSVEAISSSKWKKTRLTAGMLASGPPRSVAGSQDLRGYPEAPAIFTIKINTIKIERDSTQSCSRRKISQRSPDPAAAVAFAGVSKLLARFELVRERSSEHRFGFKSCLTFSLLFPGQTRISEAEYRPPAGAPLGRPLLTTNEQHSRLRTRATSYFIRDPRLGSNSWMSALPAVPAGENPFALYGGVVGALLYPTPSAGFATRILVLFILDGL
jgi:hypothetical protein